MSRWRAKSIGATQRLDRSCYNNLVDKLIYLDHAAATPLDDRVFAAMQPFFSDQFYNPSSPYAPAVYVRRIYEEARHQLAAALGGKADEIVITAGATESINIMFGSVDGHVVTSSIEHAAVLEVAKRHEHTLVSPDSTGMISAQSVARAIRPNTSLVSIQLANNELGTIQPLRAIAAIVKSERQRRRSAGETTPIYFHTDASQGVGHIDCSASRLGVDAVTLNAGKIYGPKQVGLLWAASHVKLLPHIVGGGQEMGLRSGTENVAGAVGFATALELAVTHKNSEVKRLATLRDHLQSALLEQFPTAIVSGNQKKRLPGYLNISFPGLDAERLLFMLETRNVLVATGSACAANKGTRSHVLTAIGLAPDVADGSLRITLGRLTNEHGVERALAIIKEVVSNEYERVAS